MGRREVNEGPGSRHTHPDTSTRGGRDAGVKASGGYLRSLLFAMAIGVAVR